jgi:hypothetical protein
MLDPYDYLDHLHLHPLPADVHALLAKLAAPPLLIAHLLLVHDVAVRLIHRVQREWPDLSLDVDTIQFGAATHDVGKIVHPLELVSPGNQHEQTGRLLLLDHGVPPSRARFAQTHGQWKNQDQVEDLLVAVADTCWKGTRKHDLEQWLTKQICHSVQQDIWDVFLVLDDMIEALAADGNRRLAWQAQFPIETRS